MKADYTRWKQRLAGEKVMTFTEPDENDVGCYRLPIKERKQNAAGHNNGQWKTIGFKPVLLGVVDGELRCQIAGEIIGEDRRNDLWTSFVQHPVTEAAWAAAESGHGWHDFTPPAAMVQVDESGVGAIMDAVAEERTAVPPQDDIKRRLDALKTEAPKFAKIDSDEQSSAGRSLQAQFLEIRGEAADHYEKDFRPLNDQIVALRKIWFPIRDEADEAKTLIGEALGGWEDVKRIAAKRAQEKADREAREHAEATRLAEEANQPPPPPSPVDKPNLPPPSAQIKAPGVRAAKVKLQRIVTEIDVEKAFAQFKAAPEVREVLMSLAQRAVTAGLPVDGATIEERSKVS